MTVIPSDLAGAVLSIDLSALQTNFKTLSKKAGTAACGAAIKGQAYGLGIAPVSKALWDAGCRDYFVARPKEGEELRGLLPDATILCSTVCFPAKQNSMQSISYGLL